MRATAARRGAPTCLKRPAILKPAFRQNAPLSKPRFNLEQSARPGWGRRPVQRHDHCDAPRIKADTRGVRIYSFQIDPAANFRERRRRTAPGLFAPERILAALKMLSPGNWPKPVAKPHPSRIPRVKPTATSLRAATAAPANDVIAARQMRYENYAISTSQLGDGRWVASFGRPDGGLIRVDGKSRPVSVTKPYFAETLAIAAAQARIDALAAGEKPRRT